MDGNEFLDSRGCVTRGFPGVRCSRLHPSSAGGAVLSPGWVAKIPHASWPKNKKTIEQKQYCNKFSKDFKNGKKKKKKKKERKKERKLFSCSFVQLNIVVVE